MTEKAGWWFGANQGARTSRTYSGRRATDRLPPMKAKVLLTCCLFTVVSIIGTRSIFHSPAEKQPTIRAELVEALGHCRNIEARLTGGQAHIPYVAGASCNISSQAALAIRRREKEVFESRSVEALANSAFVDLLDGKTAEGIVRLEEAITQAPQAAQLQVDLSAAYITRARHDGQALDLLRAFELAERAAQAKPPLPEAYFNLALVLEDLLLIERAREAWRRYLQIEREPGWLDEGRAKLEFLKERSDKNFSQEARQDLESAALNRDASEVRRLVSQFRRPSRVYVEEELLPKWALLSSQGQKDAAKILEIAKAISEALAEVTRDSLMASAIGHGEDVIRTGQVASDSLLNGYINYRRGRELYRQARYAEAQNLLQKAQRELDEARSPFALRALFALACSVHYDGQHGQALKIFMSLESTAAQSGYRSLYGEILWMRGLAHLANGEPSESEEAYFLALREFKSLGDLESVAGVENLWAELLDEQGASDEAWDHRLNALRTAGNIGDPQRLYQLFSVLALASHLQGQEKLALYYQDEAVRNAVMLRNPLALGNALFWRANYLHQVGARVEVSAVLVQARIEAARLPDSAEKERLLSEILLVEARHRFGIDGQNSISFLTQAIQHSQSVPKRFDNKATLYLLRARALRGTGQVSLAEEDLKRGIQVVEGLRSTIHNETHRVSFLDESRELYDEMVLLQLEDRGNIEEALNYAERSRARALSEELLDSYLGTDGFSHESVRNADLAGRLRELPNDTIMITYALVDDSLITWVFDQKGMRSVVQSRDSRRINELVEALGRAVGYRSDRMFDLVVSDLYEILVRPVRPHMAVGVDIVFNCDGLLQRVPFSALLDRDNGRRLIEDSSVSVVPSGAVYLQCLFRIRALNLTSSPKALIVGNPAFDQQEFPLLSLLPSAEHEGRAAAGFYRESLLLEGSYATKQHFLKMLDKADVIQFSGHAIARSDKPLLSRLIFAPTLGEGESSSLDAREIYTLSLRRPRIVVLSGCGTAEGKLSSSEGVEGLARAFLATGVPAVVGSLWDVDDSMAADLLRRFHLSFVRGETPAHALRDAQLWALRHPERKYRSARRWSVFQLTGA